MQATVHIHDDLTGAGQVLLDTGRALPYAPEVFSVSGLRHLRLGQRVSVVVEPADPEDLEARVTRLWIVGIGVGQPIA